MILDHVAAQNSDFRVVVFAATFHADRLGNVELDVVDMILVPQRLEDAIGEAERKKVLDCLFTKVMINPVYLRIRPNGPAAGRSVRWPTESRVREGFFGNDTRPTLFALFEARIAEVT